MDPYNSDPFDVPAWSQVQHAVSEEPRAGQAGQEGFEQHLAEASQADTTPIASGGSDRDRYPHLSTEDWNLIDSAVRQYAAQKNPQPNTVRLYTQALRRLGNDLRARGRTTDLGDHQSLVDHVNTYFSKNEAMKVGVSVLRAYHGHPAPVARRYPDRDHYPHLSTEDRVLIDRAIARYAAQKNPQPNTVRLYTQALRRLGNDLRARGQMIDLGDHQSLVDHVNTHFSKDVGMKTGLGILRAYHDSGHLVSRERPRTIPPAVDASSGQQSPHEPMGAPFRTNLLPGEEVIISHEHDAAELRPAKRPRTSNDSQSVAIERQVGEIANSDRGAGAMTAASARQLAQPTGIVIGEQWDKRPLYSEDLPVILRLEEALIKAGMTAPAAKSCVTSLLGFSRWLFAKNKPSIIARLDSKSLSDGADVQEFSGKSNNARLLKALEHLRTFRSTGGVAPVVRPGRSRAKLNLHALNVAAENAVPMEPRRVDDAATAAHSASREAGGRPVESQEPRDDQPAPSAITHGHVAFDPEQTSQGEHRRVLNHLDDQPTPSAVSVRPDELPRLVADLHDELHGQWDNPAAQPFLVDPEELAFNPEQLPAGELRRLLDNESAQADELQDPRDDQPAPSAVIQGHVAFNPEQISQGELQRVLDHLDDHSIPSSVSVPSDELLRLEKDLYDELHGRRDNPPAQPFFVDPEELTFNPEQFPQGELLRLLDDEPAQLEVDRLPRQSPIDE
ncbi:hypothetical protein [Bradyrhizobium sp. ORS 86]|uniref:hypothetical protein n=1 Tax=Bradyrhizobium sp. ORS 86 TaxID=1685970 RepID=UPI003890CE49